MKSFLIAGFPLVGTVLHFSPKSLGQSQDVRSGAVLMGAGPQPGGDNQGVTPPKKLKNVFSCYVQQQVIILFPRPRTTQRSPGREQHSVPPAENNTAFPRPRTTQHNNRLQSFYHPRKYRLIVALHGQNILWMLQPIFNQLKRKRNFILSLQYPTETNLFGMFHSKPSQAVASKRRIKTYQVHYLARNFSKLWRTIVL